MFYGSRSLDRHTVYTKDSDHVTHPHVIQSIHRLEPAFVQPDCLFAPERACFPGNWEMCNFSDELLGRSQPVPEGMVGEKVRFTALVRFTARCI